MVISDIDKKNVCYYLGYGSDSEPPPRIFSLIEEYAAEAENIIEPLYSYVIRDIEAVEGSKVLIEGPALFQSEVIARLLEQCCKVGIFVVTIGQHLEEMACQLAEDGLILQAYVLDAVGSDAVERVAESAQGLIGEEAAAQGLVISRRFSPGYCDWDIGQQRMFFRAMRGDVAGVRLTERGLMVPQKSISGIIGIGTPDSNVSDYNPCKACDKVDCRGRR